MKRLPALLLVALAAGSLSGCATDGESKTMVTDDGMIAPKTEDERAVRSERKGDEEAGVGDWALTVPKNVVWWPWKAVGTMTRGIWDGSAAGFTNSDYPVLGAVFLPLNAVTGLLTGLVEGVAMAPGYITPDEDFGHTMGVPLSRPTTIWWYE